MPKATLAEQLFNRVYDAAHAASIEEAEG